MGVSRKEIAALLANEIEDAIVRIDRTKRRKSVEAAGRLGGLLAALILEMPRDARERPDIISTLEEAVRNLISGLSGTEIGAEPDNAISEPSITVPKSDWAGPVAGPTMLEEQYGIARSTLHRWQRRGEAIAFRTGGRKHVFPLLQFVDGRPVPGLDRLSPMFESPREVWLWLTRPCSILDGDRPIDLLRKDLVLEVMAAAQRRKPI